MKKINLSVHIEDNELLEKSIQEAIQSQARQVARETLSLAISGEIERISDAKVKELTNGTYWKPIVTKITDIMASKFAETIKMADSELSKMIEVKVSEHLDKQLAKTGGLDAYLQKFIDRSIANVILQNSRK